MTELVLAIKMDQRATRKCPGTVSIVHDSDRYELIKDIGSGSCGITRLMRDKQNNDLVAIKYIERGGPVSFET